MVVSDGFSGPACEADTGRRLSLPEPVRDEAELGRDRAVAPDRGRTSGLVNDLRRSGDAELDREPPGLCGVPAAAAASVAIATVGVGGTTPVPVAVVPAADVPAFAPVVAPEAVGVPAALAGVAGTLNRVGSTRKLVMTDKAGARIGVFVTVVVDAAIAIDAGFADSVSAARDLDEVVGRTKAAAAAAAFTYRCCRLG